MTCRNCNHSDDFCDGNADEQLCKNCLDRFCEDCFSYLETDLEYDTHLCDDCYTGPRHFTFFDWEIEEFEEEQERLNELKLACEKRKKKKEEQHFVKPMSIKDMRKERREYWDEEQRKESLRRYDELMGKQPLKIII